MGAEPVRASIHSRVEVELSAQAGGTLVELGRTGRPATALREEHARGWTRHLGRLAEAA